MHIHLYLHCVYVGMVVSEGFGVTESVRVDVVVDVDVDMGVDLNVDVGVDVNVKPYIAVKAYMIIDVGLDK